MAGRPGSQAGARRVRGGPAIGSVDHFRRVRRHLAGSAGRRPELATAARRLREANLTAADLVKVEAVECQAAGAVFRGANLLGADFTRADLRETDLRDALLNSVRFNACDLRTADLRGAWLRSCWFGHEDNPALLSDARLGGCRVEEATGVLTGPVDVGETAPQWIDGAELAAWFAAHGAPAVRVVGAS
ncbi:MAG: pentapeptide repeat-containing protein [Actinobacteria bacterium]|nr:MAG: pentapeptide repeat-containing protein [Actinomycetota bacterium]